MDLVVSSFDLVYKFNDFTYCSHSTNFLLELCVADSYFFFAITPVPGRVFH
jgi:hypothetical protein